MTNTDTGPDGRTRWAPVVVLALAMLMVTLEISLSAVTLPRIADDLGVGSGAAGWVMLAYVLPGAALAIPAGRWVDGADPRAVFVVGVVGIGLTGVLAAAAPTFAVLIVARVLQGVAGALVTAIYMPVIATAVPPDRRGRALGAMATIVPLGSMAGTSVGGLLSQGLGWRAVMLMKVPVLVVVLVAGLRAVPRRDGRLPRPGRDTALDALGLGGALTALLLAVDFAGRGAWPAAAVMAVALPAFAWGWSRLASSGQVLALVRRPAYGLPLLSMLLTCTYVGLSLFLLPFYVSDVLDRGPRTMGFAMMFFVGSLALTSWAVGSLTDRFPVRLVASAGAAVGLVGTVLMLTLGEDAGVLDIGWRLALIAVGQSGFATAVTTGLLAATPPDRVGLGGGIGNTVRTLAFTLGPALASVAYTVAGGGTAGFRTGVLVLTVLQGIGLVVVLCARTPSGHEGPTKAPATAS